jgi:hypothetical protein
MGSFRNFLESKLALAHPFSKNTVGTHNDFATASFLPSTWTGSDSFGTHSQGLTHTDLQLPSVSRKSRIRSVEERRNPIRVRLMDGTTMYLTPDEFRRIDSRTKLHPGREITVTFQRREEDDGPDPSKILSVS